MANGLGRGLGSLIPQKTNNQPTSNTASAIQTGKSKEESQGQVPERKEMSKIKSGGISSIIPKKIFDLPQDPTAPDAAHMGKPLELKISDVSVNPFQPRKRFTDSQLDELADSIKEFGVIQPLIVTKKGDKYELIAGERRFRASKKAGLETVPVVVREADDKQKLELAIIENLQRENLNPIDLGTAYRQLMDEFNLTQEEVAKRMSKSRSSVANTVRMLNLPEEIRLALIEGRLTEGHAKYLGGLDSSEKQMILFRKILHNKLSVKDTSSEVDRMGGTKASRKPEINYQDKDKEFTIREFFGTKAEIKRGRKGGKIVISFFSDEELSGIISRLK